MLRRIARSRPISSATRPTSSATCWSAAAALAAVLLGSLLVPGCAHQPSKPLAGLRAAATVTREVNGIMHIRAGNAHDSIFLQGYSHAADRLFQMDVSRRQASGTLAELLGPDALASDVQLRTLGLRRAAEASVAALSPRMRALLDAYAAGVNAYVNTHPLPAEYGLLELTRFDPWMPADSVAIVRSISFQLSFQLDVESTATLLAYENAGTAQGFDGCALYFADLFRVAPLVPVATDPTPPWTDPPGPPGPPGPPPGLPCDTSWLPAEAAQLIASLATQRPPSSPLASTASAPGRGPGAPAPSNAWAIAPPLSQHDVPLLANDPHLPLTAPAIFYPIHLQGGPLDAFGSSIPGAPLLLAGQTRRIAWGVTAHQMDEADTFLERVVPAPDAPSGLGAVHDGEVVPILAIPQRYRQNNLDGVPDNLTEVPPGDAVPAATLLVPGPLPRPIVALDRDSGLALSVVWTGFAATRELDAFLRFSEADDLDDFRGGLPFFDTGSLNLIYADVGGTIAYFATAEMPLREDLQAGVVQGLPPFFVRDGTGGNDWIPVQTPAPGQALPVAILPPEEMPQAILPAPWPMRFLLNSNNDPTGLSFDNDLLNQWRPDGGIYYLGGTRYAPGLRAGRVRQLIAAYQQDDGALSFAEMIAMQADTVLLDAQLFVPYILQAFAHAQKHGDPRLAALAADPAVAEAVQRLARWDLDTPTGIAAGYDARDVRGLRLPPTRAEIRASIAATIYQVWRGQFVQNTIDATLAAIDPGLPVPEGTQALVALEHLLATFPERGGVGAAGLDFFAAAPGDDAASRRDFLILESLADALGLLASPAFAPAFGRSTDQDDYRWGKLHRAVLESPLGALFSIPPAGGRFPPPLPGLAGIPVDGGAGTVDVGPFPVRADSYDDFVFAFGPVRRYVAKLARPRIRSVSSLAGGVSGELESPFYINLLPDWLTNDTYPVRTRPDDIRAHARAIIRFVPAQQP